MFVMGWPVGPVEVPFLVWRSALTVSSALIVEVGDGWMLTTLTNARVKYLGKYFVVARGWNGIVVILAVHLAALFVDEGHGLGLGDF